MTTQKRCQRFVGITEFEEIPRDLRIFFNGWGKKMKLGYRELMIRKEH